MEEYTRDREKELFRQAQAGDGASLNALMRRHERLVHAVVRQQWSGGWCYAEVVQEGRIGLWRAILKYDPARGTAFSTYAWPAITRQVWDAVKRRQRAAEAAPPYPPIPATDESAADWAWTCQLLREMVARLPAQEQQLVIQYYGLDGGGGCTQRALSARLGCTRQAVGYHLQKACRRLRHPGWSGELRAHLGLNRRATYRAALGGSS
ncbi:MAG: sigma-70 family RNA polymerase sigma factor [Chromatiaceae bacterium]|nr:sigma-70 family RNA polymerase sigma factor [Chromatiaceae bacterium]